jgi:hypothetical protein
MNLKYEFSCALYKGITKTILTYNLKGMIYSVIKLFCPTFTRRSVQNVQLGP